MTLDDVVLNTGKVLFLLLKLVCLGGNEVGSGKGRSEIGNEESGKCDVEREDGLDAMSHKEGQMFCGSSGSYSVSPEDVGCCNWPL